MVRLAVPALTPECQRLGLSASQIESTFDVEILRMLRNASREGFAHDNTFISENVQRAWWVAMRGRVRGCLYRVLQQGPFRPIVGYGLLRMTEDGRWWTSIAVLPQHGGQGYGKAIMADTIRRHDGTVWSEARLDNIAAMKIHPAEDWLLLGQDERLAHFRSKSSLERGLDDLAAGRSKTFDTVEEMIAYLDEEVTHHGQT